MKIVVLLVLLTVSERSSSSSVVGQLGHNVTLSCKYDIRYNGATSVCWDRGWLPASGCSNQLISTDGQKVVESSRASSRYQLLGRLDEGDVSLTILNVSESDAGRYGCRVEIYGWYNDEKHHFDLTVVRAVPTTPSTTPTRETPTEPTAANHMTAQLTSSESLFTSSSSSTEAELQNSGSANVVLVCVLFELIALVTAGGFFFIVRRRRQRNKIPQQVQFGSSSSSSSSSSILNLHCHSLVVYNIHPMDHTTSIRGAFRPPAVPQTATRATYRSSVEDQTHLFEGFS